MNCWNQPRRCFKTTLVTLMKKYYHILLAFTAMLLAGCEEAADLASEPQTINETISFTSMSMKSGGETEDSYGNPYSDRNLREVPDTVGVFINKTNGLSPTGVILKNKIYYKTNYLSDNYLSFDASEKPVVTPGGPLTLDDEQLFWYKTTDPLAYWDATAKYQIFSYAPYVETGAKNPYYQVTNDGIVTFEMDNLVGIPVDFIYARSDADLNKGNDADNLNMTYNHKLSKIVFQLTNQTENIVTCYGVRYKIKYPVATFNLLANEWTFGESSNEVEINRYAQYEIFTNDTIPLPELTTLLFPTDATNQTTTLGSNVVVEFQVCLNNKWYDMTDKLAALNLKYKEGTLIELTFNCNLSYGDPDGDPDFNIFAATFDSFEYGGVISGTLQ